MPLENRNQQSATRAGPAVVFICMNVEDALTNVGRVGEDPDCFV